MNVTGYLKTYLNELGKAATISSDPTQATIKLKTSSTGTTKTPKVTSLPLTQPAFYFLYPSTTLFGIGLPGLQVACTYHRISPEHSKAGGKAALITSPFFIPVKVLTNI